MKLEIWRWVLGWRGFYKVSNYSRVISVTRYIYYENGSIRLCKGRVLRPKRSNHGGYLEVVLSGNGERRTIRVHRLALESFVGPCPEGMDGLHKDDNKCNNFIENLYWGTHQENMRDREKNGTSYKGDKNPNSKLKIQDVKLIRKLYSTGKYSQQKLGDKFGVCQYMISCIVLNKNWKSVA